MGRFRQWKAKLLLTAVYGCVLLAFRYFRLPCVFVRFLQIPCPGCGMSRAVFSALQLDFSAAFAYHSMFWSMPLVYLYFLLDGKLLGHKLADRTVLILIAAGFLIQWVWKLVEM